jgi:hypothetical protein
VNVADLLPEVQLRVPFAPWALVHVPDDAGCYALCALADHVLYVGRAKNLRRRADQHLARRAAWAHPEWGFALTFFYRPAPVEALAGIERGWMNVALLADGRLPPWNSVYAA